MPRKLWGPSATIQVSSYLENNDKFLYVAGFDFEVTKKSLVFIYDEKNMKEKWNLLYSELDGHSFGFMGLISHPIEEETVLLLGGLGFDYKSKSGAIIKVSNDRSAIIGALCDLYDNEQTDYFLDNQCIKRQENGFTTSTFLGRTSIYNLNLASDGGFTVQNLGEGFGQKKGLFFDKACTLPE